METDPGPTVDEQALAASLVEVQSTMNSYIGFLVLHLNLHLLLNLEAGYTLSFKHELEIESDVGCEFVAIFVQYCILFATC